MNDHGRGRDGLGDIGGASAGPLPAAVVLPMNVLGGGRDVLGYIGGAVVGPRQAAAAVLPVNGLEEAGTVWLASVGQQRVSGREQQQLHSRRTTSVGRARAALVTSV